MGDWCRPIRTYSGKGNYRVMDLVDTLTRLFDVGGVVVVTAMLYVVWRRLADVTDKLIQILWELRLNRNDNGPQANPYAPTDE